jgi:hypothetical protein
MQMCLGLVITFLPDFLQGYGTTSNLIRFVGVLLVLAWMHSKVR